MYNSDAHYPIWQERSVIADCLRDLGLSDMAKNAHDATPETANKYLAIIQQEAHSVKREICWSVYILLAWFTVKENYNEPYHYT